MAEINQPVETQPHRLAYIGIKYYKDGRNTAKIQTIKQAIQSTGITPYAFVEETGGYNSPQEMTRQYRKKIDESDMLVLDATEPSIGIGIEAEYAFGKKPIYTIAERGALVSDSIKGLSDAFVEYENADDLKRKLQEVIVR